MRPLSATEVCLFMYDPFSKRLAFIFLLVLIACFIGDFLPAAFLFYHFCLAQIIDGEDSGTFVHNLSPAFDATWPGLHSFEQRSCQSNLKR